MFRKYFLILALAVSIENACALENIVDKPVGAVKGLAVIAPAKKYLMKERLFTELAHKLKSAGYITVRFNWSADTLKVPEQEIARAARDIHDVVRAAQSHFRVPAARTVLISKSFSTKAILPSLPLARMHILLTPNCSIEAPFKSTYAAVLAKEDIVLRMLISANDPYCPVEDIRQTLQPLSKLYLLGVTAHGDHNFVVMNGPQPDYSYQDQVVRNIMAQIELNFR